MQKTILTVAPSSQVLYKLYEYQTSKLLELAANGLKNLFQCNDAPSCFMVHNKLQANTTSNEPTGSLTFSGLQYFRGDF